MRQRTHAAGNGPRYTAARLPVRIVYPQEHDSLASAITRERQLKRWSAQKKEALIAKDLSALKQLARRRRK
jgi:predicted GIY-YIG superfamily endonuclease